MAQLGSSSSSSTDRRGNPKVGTCTLPLTGQAVVVHRVITDLAVIDIPGDGTLVLRETAPGVSVNDVLPRPGRTCQPQQLLLANDH
jgi:3-oxoacid CoA-transferase subunit B